MSSVGAESVSPNFHPKPPGSSGFVERVLAIPLVSFVVTLYGIIKRKSPLLDRVLSRGERVFFIVKRRVSSLTRDLPFKLRSKIIVPRVDALYAAAVVKVTQTWSTVIVTSRKMLHRGKRRVRGFVQRKIGFVLCSLPGQVVMWSLDRACGVSEAVLFLVRPDLRKKRQIEAKSGQNGTSTVISKHHIEKHERGNAKGTLFRILVVFTKPLEILVYIMQGVQSYLHHLADTTDHSKKNGCLSPEKQTEIQSRRKVSPRKKIKTGLVSKFQRTINYFGLAELMPGLRRKFHIDISGHSKGQLVTSPNKAEDEEKKRKYEDILSESESDSETEDLNNMDLDKYVSDEDPDFKPNQSGNSTDSEEYREGDTESDIEFETTLGGTIQVKTRTKSQSSKSSVKDEGKENKPETAKGVDSSRAKEQTKASPLKAAQVSVRSPPKSTSKPTALKCSTPKHTAGKENSAPQESKPNVSSGPKKATDSKSAPTEAGDKKPDQKNNQVANGDKKSETKTPTNGSKKVTNGDKK
ncbi:micronuclear linker histone polyprotein-like isoform X1 [Haliotis cracherodii]|uniref:micronuclear linker histone polyprotein-like isoform X1 n=1 Tax=Haliotis cracherodii TaxID=6455 RepID=UPI0039ED419A